MNDPPLLPADQSRGANEWMSAADELKAFQVDPRFEVNLFAGEERFPEIAKSMATSVKPRCNQCHVVPGQGVIPGPDLTEILKETDDACQVATSLLTSNTLTTIRKSDVEEKLTSTISPMPVGLVDMLTKIEIRDLHVSLEHGDFPLPEHLRKQHLPQ